MLRVIMVAISLLLTQLASGQASAEAIGTVVASSGSASASGPGGSRALSGGSPVFEHDKITVSGGNAQIILLDGTKLVVGANSALILEKFLLKGASTAQNVSIEALRGTFRFITGNSPKSAYNIQTANATIGIRGTGFDFFVAERTGVALLKGRVTLCSKTHGHSCVELQPTCAIGVAGDPAPAHIIKGLEKTEVIGNRLPYLINQTPLRAPFQLSTASCSRDLPQEFIHHRDTPNQPVPTKNGAAPRKNGASPGKNGATPKKNGG